MALLCINIWLITHVSQNVTPSSLGFLLWLIVVNPSVFIANLNQQICWRKICTYILHITFGGRSAHLAYYVHRNGHKTSIIIILDW